MNFLAEMMMKLDKNNENWLLNALRKWALQAKKINQKEQADIICRFCKDYLMDYTAVKNWHKLASKLRALHGTSDKDEILRKLRQLAAAKKLCDPLLRKAKKDALDILKKNKFFKCFIILIFNCTIICYVFLFIIVINPHF